jgi:hypothetical protein
MYSGKIAVPPGGGGILKTGTLILQEPKYSHPITIRIGLAYHW